jgi:hypothetical protein
VRIDNRRNQLEEIRRASRYPKFPDILKPHRVGRLVDHLHQATLIEVASYDQEAVDPHEAWLLAMVTGDRRVAILNRRRAGAARIITAQEFCYAA